MEGYARLAAHNKRRVSQGSHAETQRQADPRRALSDFLIFVRMLDARGLDGSNGMDERRRFPRTELNEPAFISSAGSVMRCTVLNISPEGCAIEVNEPAFVPQRFRLVMAADSSIVRHCQIAWIQQNRIGLTFVAATQAARPAEPASSQSPLSA